MFAPLREGVYTPFTQEAIDKTIEVIDRRPVAAGIAADGEILDFPSNEARYSWLV